MPNRQSYTLTSAEWLSLGGHPEPEGFDPEVGKLAGGIQNVYRTFGATVPTFDPHSAVKWQEIAERLGVRMLSIRWPDPHYPDITAEPLE